MAVTGRMAATVGMVVAYRHACYGCDGSYSGDAAGDSSIRGGGYRIPPPAGMVVTANAEHVLFHVCRYEEIKAKDSGEATLRQLDKLGYRYPRGESYFDILAR